VQTRGGKGDRGKFGEGASRTVSATELRIVSRSSIWGNERRKARDHQAARSWCFSTGFARDFHMDTPNLIGYNPRPLTSPSDKFQRHQLEAIPDSERVTGSHWDRAVMSYG
jgi:hypothetical protein